MIESAPWRRLARDLSLCGWLAVAACSKAPPSGFAELERSTLPSAAEMPISLGYVFGGAIELVGAKVSPVRGLKPGARVDVTLYWRRLGPVPRGYRLFSHLLDGAGERLLTLDTAGPLRKTQGADPVLWPSDFREGKIYVDSFAFWVPSSVRTDTLSLVSGLFHARDRLPISRRPPATAPRHDGDRALVTRLELTPTPVAVPSAIPELWVPRRSLDVHIDGKLDEAAWQRAAPTLPFVDVATGAPPSVEQVTGQAKLMYDERALYVGVEVFDDDLRGGFDPALPDPHLWTKDAVEIMVDPDGDGDNLDYYELQIGPQNLVFDSRFDAYNSPRQEPSGPFGHQEWSARAESAVTLNGTLDDGPGDEGYVVELRIPWQSFDKAKRVPPTGEDTWRMNFYAVKNNSGSAWSPILGQGNFHKASRFGRVHFVELARRAR